MVCCVARPEVVFTACGHCVLCDGCTSTLLARGSARCPTCRVRVRAVGGTRLLEAGASEPVVGFQPGQVHTPVRARALAETRAAETEWNLQPEEPWELRGQEFEEILRRLRENDTTRVSLQRSGTTATFLDLSAHHRTTTLDSTRAVSLAWALSVNTTYETLDLFGNDTMGDAGLIALAEALKVNKTLKRLMMQDAGISGYGAFAIAEMFKVNNSLKVVYFVQNNFGDFGATLIAEALKTNKTLTFVCLCDNNITDLGASAIAEALKVNNTLTSLDLSHNFLISDRGAYAFAGALKINNTLKQLEIGGTQIRREGALSLAKAFQVNTGLRLVCIHRYHKRPPRENNEGLREMQEANTNINVTTEDCLDEFEAKNQTV